MSSYPKKCTCCDEIFNSLADVKLHIETLQSRTRLATQLLFTLLEDNPNIPTGSSDNNVPNSRKRRKRKVNCLYCSYTGRGQWVVDRHAAAHFKSMECPDCQASLQSTAEFIKHGCRGETPGSESFALGGQNGGLPG
ncbi:hypothetical protein FOXYSP1_20253 [Fusarium oxysporum f. sp. phaseoli]